ncbi:DMT family transporter [Tateyamaria sp. SN6-1]|uniref:DMT family transporter n=1 Tax=Tateyamaria sp. SN6-1 TaxID=3092148 RepID=UPI0039F5CB8C
MAMTSWTGPMLGALTVLCWSGYNVAAKQGIDAGMSPDALAFLRFAVPGVFVLPALVLLHVSGRASGVPLARLAVLILLGGPLFGLIAVSGYAHAPLSHGLLFAPVAVFVTGAVLGRVLLGQAIGMGRLAGAAVMFAGLALLIGLDLRGLAPGWQTGAAFFVTAGCLWGGYTVLLRLWRIPMIEGTLSVAGGSALVAVPLLGASAVESLGDMEPAALVLQIVMQGLVGGVLSVVALIGAVRMLPVQVAALLPVFTPVVALAIACVLFGAVPSVAECVGVLIIAVGFALSLGGARSLPNEHRATGVMQRRVPHSGTRAQRGISQ